MKHFAEMEMLRRRSEKNLRAYSAREKMQEKEDHDKVNCLFGDVFPVVSVYHFLLILINADRKIIH